MPDRTVKQEHYRKMHGYTTHLSSGSKDRVKYMVSDSDSCDSDKKSQRFRSKAPCMSTTEKTAR